MVGDKRETQNINVHQWARTHGENLNIRSLLIIPEHTFMENNTEKILRIVVTATLNNAVFIWLYLIHMIKEFINMTLQVAVAVKDNSSQCLRNRSPENNRILQSNTGRNTFRSAAPTRGEVD